MHKYKVISVRIKKQIEEGIYAPGARIPSIRDLTNQFDCSKETVKKALTVLEQQHLVYARPQSGYYVIESAAIKHENKDEMVYASTSFPNIQTFPYENFEHCVIQAITTYKENLFYYTKSRGLPSLLQTMKLNLEEDQIFTKLDHIFMTTGAQQAIDILSRMPFPNNNQMILVEQPTFYGALKAFELNRVPTIGINRDLKGIDLDELELLFKKKRIKFFYTTPRLHHPVGYSYSKEEMQQILYLADKYHVYIVEDDYMADFIDSPKELSMFAYDVYDRVINIRSFSKIMFPGLRLAATVLPKVLIDTFQEYKTWTADVNSSVISQGGLDIFIKSGLFSINKERTRTLHANRMAYLIQKIEENQVAGVQFSRPKGGFYLSLYAESGINCKRVYTELLKQKIELVDIRGCFLPQFRRNRYIRLSTSKLNEETIDWAIPMIMKKVQDNVYPALR